MRTRASDRTGPRPAVYIAPGGRVSRADRQNYAKVRPMPAEGPFLVARSKLLPRVCLLVAATVAGTPVPRAAAEKTVSQSAVAAGA